MRMVVRHDDTESRPFTRSGSAFDATRRFEILNAPSGLQKLNLPWSLNKRQRYWMICRVEAKLEASLLDDLSGLH